MITIEQAREQFPGLAGKVFLDSACVSLAPLAAVDAVRAFLDDALLCRARSATLHHIAMDEAREIARGEVSRLIGADEDEVALVESTTHGLTIAARALAFERGDNILVPDTEFIQVPLAWRQSAGTTSPEIRLVANRAGALPPAAFLEQIDGHTRAVVVSSVQWSNGYRCDLGTLGRIYRERGVLLIVDGIQQVGAFRLDVRETPVDILACGGHKWLNAPFGAGFLYIRREVQGRLVKPLSGYLAVVPPAAGWGAYFQTPSISPLGPVSFANDARRYETGGTSNYPGAVGLAASVRLIHAIGIDVIEAHIRGLTERLFRGLRSLAVQVVTPVDDSCRSGIVTFGLGGDAGREKELMEFLLDRKILVSLRYTSGVGGVRVSCHYFNSPQDIDTLLNAVEAFQSTH